MRPANQPPTPSPAPPFSGVEHLPLPLLRRYVAGDLPAAEQHRVEAHTLTCARCADVLEGLSVSDAPTTDAALAELRGRLSQRLAREAEPARGGVAWRALAAVVLLLVLSTAAWLGLRPSRPAARETAAVTRRPAPTAVAPPAAESAPVAAPSAPPKAAVAPAAAAVASASPDAGLSTAAVRPARPAAAPARRPAVAMRRPPRPATPTAAASAADVAAVLAEPARSVVADQPAAAAPPAARVAAAPAAPDSAAGGRVAALGSVRAKAARAEESADRKASLPPAVTISPQPVGGYRALREYLHREALFVPEPPAPGLSGSVRLTFTVTAAGKVENIKVTRGLRPDYDAEAIRMVCEGPAWQPGVSNGRRADQVVELSIAF